MTEKNRLLKEFIMWATENDQSRKEAIDMACKLITFLYTTPKHSELSKEQIEQISGGKFNTWSAINHFISSIGTVGFGA